MSVDDPSGYWDYVKLGRWESAQQTLALRLESEPLGIIAQW